MPSNRTQSNDRYPTWVGFIFIFNLIVGTGALTLPAVFAKAGWLLSVVVIMILAGISYITVTFVIEAIACANAVIKWQHLQYLKQDCTTSVRNDEESDSNDLLLPSQEEVLDSNNIEEIPLPTQQQFYYSLNRKVEMGEMAGMFFNDFGRVLFYLCLSTYLYGDLSIYSAAVAKSLRDVVCDHSLTHLNNSTMCWEDQPFSRLFIYRIFLTTFISLLGPFVLFNIQKTKYIQMFTVAFRWCAFTTMIGIAIKRIVDNGAQGHPVVANVMGLPALFGACVYSFMCHHSLPSLLTPLHNKNNIRSLLSYDYILICSFYIFLSVTGIFAFADLKDLYTLNFVPKANELESSIILKIIDYFLALFPVFTLTASFPVIAITLRNNLQTLFLDMSRIDSYNTFVRRLLFPIMTIVPPFIITYFTESVTNLVDFTGCYAGVVIQYLIPIALVYKSRRICTDLLGRGILNDYRSPFHSTLWLLFVLVWAVACMCLVTLDFFMDVKQ